MYIDLLLFAIYQTSIDMDGYRIELHSSQSSASCRSQPVRIRACSCQSSGIAIEVIAMNLPHGLSKSLLPFTVLGVVLMSAAFSNGISTGFPNRSIIHPFQS